MLELFDYGEVYIPASLEVAWYEIEQGERDTDWRLVASEHFSENETCGSLYEYESGMKALALAVKCEQELRDAAKEIYKLNSAIGLEYTGPNN